MCPAEIVPDLGDLAHRRVSAVAFCGIAQDDDQGTLAIVDELTNHIVGPAELAHQGAQRLPEHRGRPVAEEPLGGRIDGKDLALGIERDDGVSDLAVGFRGGWR